MRLIRRLEKEETKMQIEQSKARILADCIEAMAADAEDKGKDSFGIHLSLDDAHMITCALSTAPNVNAVPVVQCKDCKYYKPDEFECGCDFAGGLPYVKAGDFCSYGLRKNQSADVHNMEGGNEHE